MTEKRTRVAIVGFASSSRDMVPYADESFEVWSLNHAYSFIQRWDRWFEIHPFSHFTRDLLRDGGPQDGKRHLEWLASEPAGKRPVYCQDTYSEIAASVKWPRDEINAWFASQANGHEGRVPLPLGFHAGDYFTSTPAEMVAHAIYEGFEEIHLYGVDMLQSEEYFYQRSGCEYYVGFARGRGIKVYVPPQSALCKANYVYGYTEPATELEKVQGLVDYLIAKKADSEQNKAKAAAAANTLDGAVQITTIILKLIADGKTLEEIKTEMASQNEQLSKRKQEALNTVIAMDGQIAGFGCSASWTEHFARGGKLE
jgi:hypothetical protein